MVAEGHCGTTGDGAPTGLVAHWAVHVVLHVVLSGPEKLDWALCDARDLYCFHDVVIREASAKPSPKQHSVNYHFVGLDAQGSGNLPLGRIGRLRSCPDFASALGHVSNRVDRLHRGVSQIGHFVICCDDGRTFGHRKMVSHRSHEFLSDRSGVDVGIGAWRPGKFQSFPSLDSSPSVGAQDGHTSVDFDHVEYAGYFPRGSIIDRFQLRADHGRSGNDCIGHVVNFHVDAVLSLSGHDGPVIQSAHLGAQDLEICSFLQLDRAGNRHGCRFSGKLTVTQRPSTCRVENFSALSPASIGLHAPLLGCCGNEHGTSRSSNLSEMLVLTGDATAPSGSLPAKKLAIARCLADLDLAPVGIQFLSNEHCERSADTLPHVGLGDHDMNRAIRIDHQKRVCLKGSFL